MQHVDSKGFIAGRCVLPGTPAIGWTGHTPLGLDHWKPYRTGLDQNKRGHESSGVASERLLERNNPWCPQRRREWSPQ